MNKAWYPFIVFTYIFLTLSEGVFLLQGGHRRHKEVTRKEKSKWGDTERMEKSGGRASQVEGTVCAKALRQKRAWRVQRGVGDSQGLCRRGKERLTRDEADRHPTMYMLLSSGQENFSVKIQVINIFSFIGHAVFITALQLCHCSHRQCVNRQAVAGCVSIKFYLWTLNLKFIDF